jgi:hypothetical protein
LIESYDFGRIVIDRVTYTSDVIITGEKVTAGWRRAEGHVLQVSDLSEVSEKFRPKVVVVGTGYMGMMKVPKETEQYFQDKGIEFLSKQTKDACELFNAVSGSKRTLAALHLTC